MFQYIVKLPDGTIITDPEWVDEWSIYKILDKHPPGTEIVYTEEKIFTQRG